jgi:hypothetical protein
MDIDTRTPLVLGRPFLSTANANIDVGVREISLNINGKEEKFPFKPKMEHNSQVRIFYSENPNFVQKIEVAPTKPKMDSLIIMMRKHGAQNKASTRHYHAKKSQATNKAKGKRRQKLKTPIKKTKKVWRVKESSSESSTPGPNETKMN